MPRDATSLRLWKEPSGSDYESLVAACAALGCAHAVLTFPRKFHRSPPALEAVYRELAPHSVTDDLGRARTRVVRYLLSAEVQQFLRSHCHVLYEWRVPESPEDLCFERSDRTVFLFTVAHEREAHFELRDDEQSRLAQLWPVLPRYTTPIWIRPR